MAAWCRSWPRATTSAELLPLIEQALAEARHSTPSRSTAWPIPPGPGWSGALLVGASVARSLAFAWDRPAVGVHHLEGHLLAPMLEATAPDFPFLALLVSGGHTLLADVRGLGEYQIIGSSLDDAAGEAFDKTAKLLGLPYPGGPALAQLADTGAPGRFDFPAHARSPRPRFQFQRPENRGRRRDARLGSSTSRRAPTSPTSFSRRSSRRWSRSARAHSMQTGLSNAGRGRRRRRQSAPARSS